MNKDETLEKFNNALNELKHKEPYLLKNNLSERCIAHKFAEYLKEQFEGLFDVDCEYNRRFDSTKVEQAIKRIHIQRNQLIAIGIDRFRKNDTHSIYPDIIIHKRESENNHLIIEIKKSSNDCKIDKNFDKLKLMKFTESSIDFLDYEEKDLPAPLGYKLGIYLEIGVEDQSGNHSIEYFQNGELVKNDNVIDWE